MITVTEKAKEKAIELMEKDGKPVEAFIRVGVEGGGCSGLSYKLEFDTEIKEGDITLSNPLDTSMVSAGKATYGLKCQSCHRLTEEKLVGPGWKDVTKRRQPVWIMNMITNVDMMLESDPEAQKLLEQCMVRMPNQNISQDEARKVIEFMRSNDGEK